MINIVIILKAITMCAIRITTFEPQSPRPAQDNHSSNFSNFLKQAVPCIPVGQVLPGTAGLLMKNPAETYFIKKIFVNDAKTFPESQLVQGLWRTVVLSYKALEHLAARPGRVYSLIKNQIPPTLQTWVKDVLKQIKPSSTQSWSFQYNSVRNNYYLTRYRNENGSLVGDHLVLRKSDNDYQIITGYIISQDRIYLNFERYELLNFNDSNQIFIENSLDFLEKTSAKTFISQATKSMNVSNQNTLTFENFNNDSVSQQYIEEDIYFDARSFMEIEYHSFNNTDNKSNGILFENDLYFDAIPLEDTEHNPLKHSTIQSQDIFDKPAQKFSISIRKALKNIDKKLASIEKNIFALHQEVNFVSNDVINSFKLKTHSDNSQTKVVNAFYNLDLKNIYKIEQDIFYQLEIVKNDLNDLHNQIELNSSEIEMDALEKDELKDIYQRILTDLDEIHYEFANLSVPYKLNTIRDTVKDDSYIGNLTQEINSYYIDNNADTKKILKGLLESLDDVIDSLAQTKKILEIDKSIDVEDILETAKLLLEEDTNNPEVQKDNPKIDSLKQHCFDRFSKKYNSRLGDIQSMLNEFSNRLTHESILANYITNYCQTWIDENYGIFHFFNSAIITRKKYFKIIKKLSEEITHLKSLNNNQTKFTFAESAQINTRTSIMKYYFSKISEMKKHKETIDFIKPIFPPDWSIEGRQERMDYYLHLENEGDEIELSKEALEFLETVANR
ncbi:MAG: hypothetical protein V4629_08825 [Pseudomonadota bacterium]